MNSYRLTEDAERQIIDIFLYGFETFGPKQAQLYKSELENAFQLLADNPRMGRLADSIAPGIRRHEHESHVIFYEFHGDGILILAVLHGRSVKHLKL